MGRIQKLPESLIRLIAAGEVIERPASIVKELVENSLDAGAARISVDIWGAGRTRIRVSDDGEGMAREDAELALDRHATSKLKQFDDLYHLATFGFRGEALPSIAAVSRLELSTRTKDSREPKEPPPPSRGRGGERETLTPSTTPSPGLRPPSAEKGEGFRMQLEGGCLISSGPVGIPVGTTIDVQDLFFNTPARSKFLKRDSTERTHILKTLEEMSLARPAVRFEAAMDGKSVLRLPSSKDLGGRLADLWGLSVAENLTPLEFSQGPARVRGFVNKIPAHHPTKAYQILYVNNRPVQQRMLSYAIYEAYREWLPVGRHPVFALFIDVDPKLVDVNVHPTKREVRFSDERALYDLLFTKIRGLFKSTTEAGINPFLSQRERPGGARVRGDNPSLRESAAALLTQAPLSPQESLTGFISDATAPLTYTSPADGGRGLLGDVQEMRYLGQFQKLYLLIERGEELLIMDQHAAAERVHYERLLNQAAGKKVLRQALLAPVLWDMPPSQAEIVGSYLEEFDALGFGLEAFGPTTFALKEWPASLPESGKARRFLEEILETLSAERPTDKSVIQHEIAARAACRAAIMAGDPISPPEVVQLLKDLAACQRPMTCPHGRPTHIRLPMDDLHRRFRRT